MGSIYRTVSVLMLCAATLLTAEYSFGQEQRFITDRILVPIRSGAGGEYRILNKGLPSGTGITFFGLSEDGVWAEVETAGGTRGWLRAQYLQAETPTTLELRALKEEFSRLEEDRASLVALLDGAQRETYANEQMQRSQSLELENTKKELERLTALAGRELELDEKNRTLIENFESQKTEIELLKLENIRLTDRIENNQIIDGAIAVLVGFLLAVFGPRFIPKRRKNDGWS
ncbi:MAG: TIGR04211 family SH3 domain-containing protein [Halieaceae bacterium]|jgi:SH3 domain protein